MYNEFALTNNFSFEPVHYRYSDDSYICIGLYMDTGPKKVDITWMKFGKQCFLMTIFIIETIEGISLAV